MIKNAQQVAVATPAPMPAAATDAAADTHIAPAPRISVQAFCETVETAAAVQAAGDDRRLAKAHVKIQMGGIAAATEAYNNSPTPNVIMIETDARAADILGGLDKLAEVCDAGTRVVVMGRVNDVTLYRELTSTRCKRISDHTGGASRRRSGHQRPVFGAGRQAGRPNHRRGRRQGRRGRLYGCT